MPSAGFGLYIHWPFCQAKCPYCDFNSHVWSSVDQDRWAAAYETEIDRIAALTGDRILNSVFFGGGTPSLMNVSTVDRIMARIQRNWRLANDLEVTLEANPTSTEAEKFVGYYSCGVNRVSIGVQALNDPDLRKLGRLHTADEALKAIELAKSSFDRVSFDLIYARQGQTVIDWGDELSRALALEPDHLSLYQLTIEDGTAFGERFKRGLLSGLPDEDLGADLWNLTQDATLEAGLPAYEVSNHARPDQASRHNLIYWQSGDWAGIGPGAHGRLTLNGSRSETAAHKAPGKWLTAVENDGTGDAFFESLDLEEVLEERILMGLRLVGGIEMPANWISNKINVINELVDGGQLLQSGEYLAATNRGRPLLDAIINKLMVD